MYIIHLDSNFKDELESNGDRQSTNFLSLVAIFILVMAWINYVNLTTARSVERAREIGVRKVMGSNRMQLVRQFLLESFLFGLVAISITISLVAFLLPHFSAFINRKIELSDFVSPDVWLYIAGAFVFGIIVSGLYPAWVMSGFRMTHILKSKVQASVSGNSLRKGLVSFQFISSVVLIVGIFVVYKQIRFMGNSSLGMNTEQLMVIQGPNIKDSTYLSRFSTFRESLLEYPEIKKIAVSTDVPGRAVRASNGGVRIVGQDIKMGNSFRVIQASEDYPETFGMTLIAGRTFSRDFHDHWKAALVNETAMKLLGFTDPEKIIGQRIYVWDATLEIVGVIKNFHQESLKKNVDQLIIICDTEISDYYAVKVNARKTLTEVISQAEANYKSAFPGNPFHYFFLNDYFNRQYRSDILFGKVFGLFTVLALIIACLGLFGLSSYRVIQRTREIGIRKVLGASVKQITMLVSKEFILIVIIANIIAWPIAYFIMDHWLKGFAYRIDLGVLSFLIPTTISLVIAILTVATQSIRAANTDPVRNLRTE